jgi:hypothetical protein
MTRLLLVLFALAEPQNVPLPADAGDTSLGHLRTRVERIAEALNAGYQRSNTFRTLVDDLRTAHAVVHIEAGVCKAAALQPLSGCLAPLAQTPTVRYFRIIVDPGRSQDRLVALIGHELQHAVEVVKAPTPLVLDHEVAAGRAHRTGAHSYETEQARAVTRAILNELRGPAVSPKYVALRYE